jgi:hypothetical protein
MILLDALCLKLKFILNCKFFIILNTFLVHLLYIHIYINELYIYYKSEFFKLKFTIKNVFNK